MEWNGGQGGTRKGYNDVLSSCQDCRHGCGGQNNNDKKELSDWSYTTEEWGELMY